MWFRHCVPSFPRQAPQTLRARLVSVVPAPAALGSPTPRPHTRASPPSAQLTLAFFLPSKMPMKEFHVVGRKTPTEAVRFVRVAPARGPAAAPAGPAPPLLATLARLCRRRCAPRPPRRSRSRPSTACGCLRRMRRWRRAATGACRCLRARPRRSAQRAPPPPPPAADLRLPALSLAQVFSAPAVQDEGEHGRHPRRVGGARAEHGDGQEL